MIAISKEESGGGLGAKPAIEFSSHPVNVGTAERWVSVLLGTVLVAKGIARRSAGGLLAALGGGYLVYRGQSGRCALYEMMGREEVVEPPQEIREQTSVACSREDAYRFCKDVEKLACVVGPEVTLVSSGPGRWRWTWKEPLGMQATCQVEVAEDRENELLAWRSLPDSPVETTAELYFLKAPSDRGTELHVRIEMAPMGGLIGQAVGTILKPAISGQIRGFLRRLKSMIETGEVATSAMQPGRQEVKPQEERESPPKKESEPGETPPLAIALPAAAPATISNGIEETSMESFPASDPPAWTSSKTGGGKEKP